MHREGGIEEALSFKLGLSFTSEIYEHAAVRVAVGAVSDVI